MLKSCKYCGRVHDSKYNCGKKPTKKTTAITKFRSSGRWQKQRDIVLDLDHYMCAACRDEGKYNTEYLEAHHIIPLSEDWNLRLDEDNIITLCERHHEYADQGKIDRKHLKKLIEKRSKGQ